MEARCRATERSGAASSKQIPAQGKKHSSFIPPFFYLCVLPLLQPDISLFSCLPLYFFVLTSLISSCYKNELALTPNSFLKGNPSQARLCPLWFLSNLCCNCLAVQSRLYKLINTFKYKTELRYNNSDLLWSWKNASSLCGWILRTNRCTQKQRAASKETQSASHTAFHNDGFRWKFCLR